MKTLTLPLHHQLLKEYEILNTYKSPAVPVIE